MANNSYFDFLARQREVESRGGLGTALAGAGAQLFGQLAIEKRKAENLELARSNKLKDQLAKEERDKKKLDEQRAADKVVLVEGREHVAGLLTAEQERDATLLAAEEVERDLDIKGTPLKMLGSDILKNLDPDDPRRDTVDEDVVYNARSNPEGKLIEFSKFVDTPSAGKAIKPAQWLAAGFALRIEDTEQIMNELGDFTQKIARGGGFLPRELQSTERKRFDTAKRNFINAILRRESGAAISEGEFTNANLQYFPQPDDGEAVLADKARNREAQFSAIKLESGPAFQRVKDDRAARAAARKAAEEQDTAEQAAKSQAPALISPDSVGSQDLQEDDQNLFNKYGI